MKRYCVLKNLKNQKKYKWDFQQPCSLQEIYLEMLNRYYYPQSIQERFRLLLGNHNYSEFWRLKSLESETVWNIVSDVTTCKTQIFESEREAIDPRVIELMKGWRFQATPDIMLKRPDNVYEDIVRDVVKRRTLYFYLDICLSVYYSVMYYMEKDRFIPFILKEHKEDESELVSGWNKFLRKGEDRKRRGERKNKKSEEKNKKSGKKNNYNKLSEFGVELPLNTLIRYDQRELFLSSFGADIIRFFIRTKDKETDGRRSSDILDLFSEKRMTRFTIANYERVKIEELLSNFKTYNEKDDIINQFLLEQCFGIDICENICDFLEVIFPGDKLTNVDIKDKMSHYIDLFVHELQQCIPNFSKLLILEETKNLLCWKTEDPTEDSGYLQQGCNKIKLATDIVRLLTLEINCEYKEFCNAFYNAIFRRCNKDLDQVRSHLEKEIIKTKRALHINREKNYEFMEARVFGNLTRKKHDEIYPYVQKAMMVKK